MGYVCNFAKGVALLFPLFLFACGNSESVNFISPNESLVSRYSPGYGDFPLTAQRELLSLLDAPRKVGVSLTDTLLMVPSKSVSAIIGVKEEIPTE